MSRVTARIDIDGNMSFRFPYDSWVVQGLKEQIPKWARSYDSFVKEWSIDSQYEDIAIDIIEEVFGPFDVPEREPRRKPATQTTVKPDSYATLHLLPTAPKELIAGAYKILSKLHHPDLGGSAATMQKINIAYSTLKDTAMTG